LLPCFSWFGIAASFTNDLFGSDKQSLNQSVALDILSDISC
jgi:hypothetical protein